MKKKHERMYMEIADCLARASPANRLKVGAVLVKDNRIIGCGYNALPEHMHGSCEDELGNTRPEVRHAERNALKGLEKSHESSVGATLFCTHACCLQCAIDIVDAKIVKVIYKEPYRSQDGVDWLKQNGVEVEKYEA